MATRTRSLLTGLTAIGLLILPGTAPLHGMVPSDAASFKAVPAPRSAAPVKRKASAPRMTKDECSTLALNATIAKARAEMRTLLPSKPGDLNGITAAMNSDRRLSDGVKRAFGNSDLITSQYSPDGKCVVTLKLSVDRLQLLARDL